MCTVPVQEGDDRILVDVFHGLITVVEGVDIEKSQPVLATKLCKLA